MEAVSPSRSARNRRALLLSLAALWLVGGTILIVALEMRESAAHASRSGFGLRFGALLVQLIVAVSATALLFWTRFQRSAEREARQRAEEFRQLFHDASEAMFVVDQQFVLVEVNAAACRLIGYTRSEILGRPLLGMVSPTDLARRPMRVDLLLAGERVVSERNLLRKDGSEVATEVSIQQLPDGRTLGLARDISQRRAIEQRLRLLSRAMEESPAAMVITDSSGRIEYVNPRFAEVTGWSSEEVSGKTPSVLKSGETPDAVYRDLWTAIQAGREWQGELINRRRNGELFPWLLSIHPILDEQGRIEHFLGVGEDATERRAAERSLAEARTALYQSQKMEALGRLAGGVAHDFNNLLGIILGYSDLLAANLPASGQGGEEFAEIRKAVMRASELTGQLLAFSRRQVLAVRVVELATLLEDSRKMLSRLLPESIALRLEVTPNLWSVRADSTQLVQVLVNLAVNGKDAMPLGGILVISAENVALAEAEAKEHGLSAGEYVCLKVSDTGHGMTPEVIEHAFEPFFTTRGAVGGTGLGLATVYGIVQQLDGSVEIDSSPSRGTTLILHLPRVRGSASGERALAALLPTRPVSGTILVVEDLAPLRKLVERIVQGIGYRVYSAASAQEAMAFAGECSTDIDLLLSDIVMPGMDGRDLARLMKAVRPNLRVVLMTGYSELFTDGSDVGDLGVDAIVQKPFSRAQIEKVLAEVFASARTDEDVS